MPTDDGYVLSGTWSFASGCDHSSWIRLGAFIAQPGAAPPQEGAFFLLPIEDIEIEDNWFVSVSRGPAARTSSCTGVRSAASRFTVCRNAFGRTPGAQHHKNPLYRLPLLVLGATMLASTAVGAAKGALDAYLETTTGARRAARWPGAGSR